MSNDVCHDEETGYHVYDHPERFKEQGYLCFFQSQYRNIGPVIIGIAHEMTCGPSPYFYYTVHADLEDSKRFCSLLSRMP